MTNTPSLIELAELVEAAAGPDRELGVAVFRAIGAPVPFQFASKMVALVYDETERCYFAPIGDMRVRYEPPAYTASIDAAMTLIPAECYWKVEHDGEGRDPSMFAASVFDPMTMRRRCVAVAETPALALTAAALRALAASAGGVDGRG